MAKQAFLFNRFEAIIKSALAPEDHKELRLLVTGKRGEGIATLVNGLLGAKVAVEGASFTRCTTEVTEYKAELHGVPVTVFDSSGLQDTTGDEDEYIADMKKKCQNLSLVLYCTKMTNSRLKNEDKHAILKLTAAFGQKFWEYAVLVLTFANMENVTRRDDRDEDEGPEPDYDDDAAWEELGKKRFKGRLNKWKEGFHKFLIEEIGIRRYIVEGIPVVPTGDYKITRENKEPFRLPDREDWFSEFWKVCSLRNKHIKLFYKINEDRLRLTTIKDPTELLEDPIKEEPLENHILKLTDIPAVDDHNTYTTKLQENIKKMNEAEALVKEQEEKIIKEEIVRQAEESQRKEIERQELLSVKEVKQIFKSQEKQPTLTSTVGKGKIVLQSLPLQKLRSTNTASHFCHSTPPLPKTWAPDNHEELKLLVTGKTGVGKSTLVNGLLGEEVAVEGASFTRCTTEVTEYKAELHGVPVTVFDSPGLQDTTGDEDEYIADMKKKCQNLILVLYCTKMTNNCLKDEDKYAILKLTAAFGQRFWEHAVLVLTFANQEDVSRRDDRDEDKGPEPDYDDEESWKELEKKRFEGRVEKWKEGFHKFIIQEVGVRRDIVERIPAVPAGDYRKTNKNRTPLCLPDRENWFNEFWKACSLRMKGKSYQLRELEHGIEIQAEQIKRKELEKQAEEHKHMKAEKSAKLDFLLNKEPLKSDLLKIFKTSAVHSKIIGTALDVKVDDLLSLPNLTSDNLICVFERWIDSNKDVTWKKIVQVCEDYPEELGQAKNNLKRFFRQKGHEIIF